MSRPITLPSGRVVYAELNWKRFNEAPEAEREKLLEALETLADVMGEKYGLPREEESQAVQ